MNGDQFKMEAECKTCTCRDAGVMECIDDTCPELNCAEGELVAEEDDKCCPFCLDDWVVVSHLSLSYIFVSYSVFLLCLDLICVFFRL